MTRPTEEPLKNVTAEDVLVAPIGMTGEEAAVASSSNGENGDYALDE